MQLDSPMEDLGTETLRRKKAPALRSSPTFISGAETSPRPTAGIRSVREPSSTPTASSRPLTRTTSTSAQHRLPALLLQGKVDSALHRSCLASQAVTRTATNLRRNTAAGLTDFISRTSGG